MADTPIIEALRQCRDALRGLMDAESRGRVMPIGAAWDAARAAIAADRALNAPAPSVGAEGLPPDLWALIRAYGAARVDCDRSNGTVSQQYLRLAESNLRDALAALAARPAQKD